MSNMSEDIQYAGSDTRPPMLDRTDFESWQQRIRLYCLGKDNGENIMKSITEGPFQMGTMRDTLTEGGEGALHLGPERARVFADLSAEQKDSPHQKYPTQSSESLHNPQINHQLPDNLQTGYRKQVNWMFQEVKQCRINPGRPFPRNTTRGKVSQGMLEVRNENGKVNSGSSLNPLCATTVKDSSNSTRSPQPKLPQDSDYSKTTDQCDAFDSDVDEAPTTQTMFMANLTSEEAGPSYDSNTLFEVQDHDTFVDHMDEYHEVHEMKNDVHHNYVVDSYADITSDSNIIAVYPYVETTKNMLYKVNVSSSVRMMH
ncbi:hypothetical protein Tco_1458089 [Tanacetum coccineum]